MDPLEQMPEIVDRDMAAQRAGRRRGQLAVFSCPECGGSLWQVDEKELTRFRCHVGHAFYGENLLTQMEEGLEAALWIAVRTFREKAVLGRQLAAQERRRGNPDGASRFEEEAQLAERYGNLIREYLFKAQAAAPVKPPEGGPRPQEPRSAANAPDRSPGGPP